ncbi:MAG: hypothetical protein M3R38_02990 [Actinomycetota bacterium]|nr:hypothetical protein [Actinomycetota bacterium]
MSWWRKILGLDRNIPEEVPEKKRELMEAKKEQFGALREFAVRAEDPELLEYVRRRERALECLKVEYEIMTDKGGS